MNILDNYNTVTRESRLINLNWTHTLSTKSFYEITLGNFVTMEHSVFKTRNGEYKERLDLEPINYNLDETNQDGNIVISYGDDLYDSGFAPEWYNLVSDNARLDLDWTFTKKQYKIKTGFEHTISNLQVLDIDEPEWIFIIRREL